MGTYGIFSKPEDKAIELMIGEKKSAVETSEILKEQGYNFSPAQLRRLKVKAFESLMEEERLEATADYLLNSVKKVTIEFEDLYKKFTKLAEKFENEGDYFQHLVVLREMKDMLNTSIKKLSVFSKGIESIKVDKMQIINNNNNIMQAIKENQQRWFDTMNPEVVNGKLVFNNPLPEVLDEYYKWKFRSGESKVLQ